MQFPRNKVRGQLLSQHARFLVTAFSANTIISRRALPHCKFIFISLNAFNIFQYRNVNLEFQSRTSDPVLTVITVK